MQRDLLNIIMQAYNGGWLQYHPMVIFDITITMKMHRNMNEVRMVRGNRDMYTMVYDSDLESTQESSIANLLAEMFR